MSQINPLDKNNNLPIKPLKLEEINEENADSIFLILDTDKNKHVSDEEIRAYGFVGEMFNKAKEKFIQLFGEYFVGDSKDEEGYFRYHNWKIETTVANKIEDIPTGSHDGVRDARRYDISRLNLSRKELLDLCIDKTTILSAEQKAIIDEVKEKAKDPGLGIRDLHKQGYTGKGVRMAIIDQPIGRHKEYTSRIVKNIDINTKDMEGWEQASMHAAAVTSIAVGESVGVAPEADVEFYSAVNMSYNPKDIAEWKKKVYEEMKKDPYSKKWLLEDLKIYEEMGGCPSNKPYVEAINRILDNNENAPDNEKVSVISISWGFDQLASGYDDLLKAIDRAKKQGVFIVSTALIRDYGFNTNGANRNPDGDLNNPENYEIGAFLKNRDNSYDDKLLLVPMDHRTVADFTDGESYRYEGNDGGMSWSTPWLAGMYVLAKQADSNITPEKFWAIALTQSDECNDNDTGKKIGRIINPQKLIDEVVRLKDKKESIVLEEGSFDNEVFLQSKEKDNKTVMKRKELTLTEQEELKIKKFEELANRYKSENLEYVIDINQNGIGHYKVQTK